MELSASVPSPRSLVCLLLAVPTVAFAGCSGDSNDAASTADAPAAKSFAVELLRTNDYAQHDGVATFVPEHGKTRVIMDFPVSPEKLAEGGLPAEIRHGPCSERGELAYRLEPSSLLTQTVIDVPAPELQAAFESGSLAVSVARSASNDEIVACGDAITG